MIIIDGPPELSVDNLLKLRKGNIPDSIPEALTPQGAIEGMKPFQMDLKIK
jgi:hypothetical protein